MRILLGTVLLTLALPLVGSAAHARPAHDQDWTAGTLDADQNFRGLDAVNRRVAWVSGEYVGDDPGPESGPGKVFRTTDGGKTWADVSPPTTDALSFRDVEARGHGTALVLAVGSGEASRIYRTDDGGETWTETFRNTDEAAFFNCMAFFPGGRRGLAVSDPVDGKFRIIATSDGGRSWEVLPDDGMPDSTGEYNFSASGDCLVIRGKHAYFGSGGAASRVFHSTDRGLSWSATDSTIRAGEAAGVFALAFRTPRHGLAVGGDFVAPGDGTDASAYTRRGATWHNGGDLEHLGEDVAWLPGTRRAAVVVGEYGGAAGVSVSRDGGRSWTRVSERGFHVVECTRDKVCWAAGGDGRVARLTR